MSHVDEARVSAYVDADASLTDDDRREIEEHIARCAACRELVDDVRSTGDEARSILARSGPAVIAAPSFAELLARSRQRTHHRPHRFGWMHGLAAAAVLVLAVSVGIFTGRANLALNDRNTRATSVGRDSTPSAIATARQSPAIPTEPEQPASPGAAGAVGGMVADEVTATAGVPSRAGTAPAAPEPVALRQAPPPARGLREADAAGASDRLQAVVSGEGVAAPPPPPAADQGERFEAARALADNRAASTEGAVAPQIATARRAREGATDCQDPRAALRTTPAALSCAPVRDVTRDSVAATGVIWVRQTVGEIEVSLAVVPDSLVTAPVSAAVDEAIGGRRPAVVSGLRVQARSQRPVTVMVTAGSYRVWLTASMTEEELRLLAASLVTID